MQVNTHGIFLVIFGVVIFFSIVAVLVGLLINTLHLFNLLVDRVERRRWLRFVQALVTPGGDDLILLVLIERRLIIFATGVRIALAKRQVRLGNLCLLLRLVLVRAGRIASLDRLLVGGAGPGSSHATLKRVGFVRFVQVDLLLISGLLFDITCLLRIGHCLVIYRHLGRRGSYYLNVRLLFRINRSCRVLFRLVGLEWHRLGVLPHLCLVYGRLVAVCGDGTGLLALLGR